MSTALSTAPTEPVMPDTLENWLAHLEQAHVRAIDLGLDRVSRVAGILGTTAFACPVITVAGTNGKGSTVATLTAVYVADGRKVATYTSPHLHRFNERIALDGQPVDDDILVSAFRRVEDARRLAGVSLSYFEFTTLAAFRIFADAAPDVVVLEVGLGGRLDAVNLIDADVAVITSIGIDHTDWLGDTREAISLEKAGIFRPGRPVVCGEPEPPLPMIERGEVLGCRWLQTGRDFVCTRHDGGWSWRGVAAGYEDLPWPRLAPENVSTALAAIEAAGLPVSERAVREGVRTAAVPGRLEKRLVHGVEIVLDVAHNPHGAAFFMQQLLPPAGHVRAVFAMLADKDAAATLDACLGRVDAWYPATLHVPRGQAAADLQPWFLQRGMCVAGEFSGVDAALRICLEDSRPGDRILVFGSFYTVSAARAWLENNHGYSH